MGRKAPKPQQTREWKAIYNNINRTSGAHFSPFYFSDSPRLALNYITRFTGFFLEWFAGGVPTRQTIIIIIVTEIPYAHRAVLIIRLSDDDDDEVSHSVTNDFPESLRAIPALQNITGAVPIVRLSDDDDGEIFNPDTDTFFEWLHDRDPLDPETYA